jgi:hypothetical protein
MNDKFVCWLKESWKIAVAIGSIIAVLAGFYTFANTFAKAGDIDRAVKSSNELTDKKIEIIDMKTGQAIDQVNKNMQYQFQSNRYNTLRDQERSIKIMIRQRPSDRELQQELDKVQKEKDDLILQQQKLLR